jgi:O-antigen/teichoic acid export membrane protein
VHSLGNTGYGLWTLVVSMTGYFGLLDLGIRSSVGRFVTRYIALKDDERVNRIVSTAFALLVGGGVLALIATVLIAIFLFDSFRIGPEYASAGRIALLITGLNVSCILPLGVFSAVLVAEERFDVLSGVTIVGELARASLVVWFLRHGYGLVALSLISLAITFCSYSAMAAFAKGLYRPLKIRLSSVDRSASKELFGFSIYRFVWIVANQLIFYSDAVVIAFFLGAGAVTPYAIAGSLVNYGRNIVSLLTDTLYPVASRMDASKDRAGLQRLLIVGTRMALLVTLPLCLGFLFLGRQFITLWMGRAFADSAVVLTVLTIPQFGSMSQYASALILAGMAKHRPFAYFALAEGIANLLLSVVLVQRIGLIGVAWGTVIPHLISSSIVVPLYTLHVLQLDLKEYLLKAYLRPVVSALPVLALGYRFARVESSSWLTFASEALAICAAFWVTSYFLCFDGQQRALATGRIGAMLRRRVMAHER